MRRITGKNSRIKKNIKKLLPSLEREGFLFELEFRNKFHRCVLQMKYISIRLSMEEIEFINKKSGESR